MIENEPLPGPTDWRALAVTLARETRAALDDAEVWHPGSVILSALEMVEQADAGQAPPSIGPTHADYVALAIKAGRVLNAAWVVLSTEDIRTPARAELAEALKALQGVKT